MPTWLRRTATNRGFGRQGFATFLSYLSLRNERRDDRHDEKRRFGHQCTLVSSTTRSENRGVDSEAATSTRSKDNPMALQTLLRNPMHLAIVALLALALGACSSTSESGREGGGGEGSGEHGGGGEGSEGGEGGAGRRRRNRRTTQSDPDLLDDAQGRAPRLCATTPPPGPSGGPRPTSPAPRSPVSGSRCISRTAWNSGRRRRQTSRRARPSTSRCRRPARHSPNGARMPRATAPRSRTAFTPSLGAWAVVQGVDLGIEHPNHRMSAWYTRQGGVWDTASVPGFPRRNTSRRGTRRGRANGPASTEAGRPSARAQRA